MLLTTPLKHLFRISFALLYLNLCSLLNYTLNLEDVITRHNAGKET